MKCKKLVLVFFLVVFGLLFSVNWINAQDPPAYDLTGTWKMHAVAFEHSFCCDYDHTEMEKAIMEIVQFDGDKLEIKIRWPDEDPDECLEFEGRTSNFAFGAWAIDENQVVSATLWSGEVSNNGNKITGRNIWIDWIDCDSVVCEEDPGPATGRYIFTAHKISSDYPW